MEGDEMLPEWTNQDEICRAGQDQIGWDET